MPGKFCVSLSHAKDNPDKATVAFVVANAALGSDKDTVVFLSIEGVRLRRKGYADDIHEEGFAPLKELMANFAEAGGKIYVCSPCFKKRKLDETTSSPARSSSAGRSWSNSLRRQPVCFLLTRRGDAADENEPGRTPPARARRRLRRRRPRLRQRLVAADPPAHRPAPSAAVAGNPLDRRLRRRGFAGVVPADRQRVCVVAQGRAVSAAIWSAKAPCRSAPSAKSRPHRPLRVKPLVVSVTVPDKLPAPAPAPAIEPLSVMGIGSWPRPRWLLQALHEHLAGRLAEAEFQRPPTTPYGWPSPPRSGPAWTSSPTASNGATTTPASSAARLDNCQLIPVTDLLPYVDDPDKFAEELRALDVPAEQVRHPAVFGRLGRSRPLAVHELEFVRGVTTGRSRSPCRARTC